METGGREEQGKLKKMLNVPPVCKQTCKSASDGELRTEFGCTRNKPSRMCIKRVWCSE